VLQGKNVVLRAIERGDVGRLAQLFEDLELSALASNSPPKPWPLAKYEARYERTSSEEDRVEFAIVVADEVIGEFSLLGLDHYRGVAELGITLAAITGDKASDRMRSQPY
jgi:RimJ/RimL family protein N-acetyltransferase